MHSFTSVALASMALSAAALPTPPKKTMKIPMSMNKRSGIRAALAQGTFTPEKGDYYVNTILNKYSKTLENYKSNTGSVHPLYRAESERFQKRQSETLTDQESEALWTGKIEIGSDKQSFTIDFDTGSSDLWVPSSSCTSSTCTKHEQYDPSSSTTSTKGSGTFSISYGDGSAASGPTYTDTVTIAGVSATKQAFSAVTKDTLQANDPTSGILGMGWQSISQLKSPPVFNTMLQEGAVDSGEFSFALTPNNAELYLGGTNQDLYTGDIEWVDLTQESYWVVKGDLNAAGSAAISQGTMIIDTGTSLIVGPTAQAEKFYSAIGGKACPAATCGSSGYYTYPCNAKVSFTFGNKEIDVSDTFSLGSATSSYDGECVGAFVGSSGIPLNGIIVGDTFFQKAYSVFDVTNKRVGFATMA